MALPQDGQDANGLTKVTQIPAGKELMFIDPTTNEGGIITLEDLTKQILNGLLSQTFKMDTGTQTIPAAINYLFGKTSIDLLPIKNNSSFSAVLKAKNNKMTIGYFYNPSDNPFSFSVGYFLAFQSGYLQETNKYTLIGFSNNGGVENKTILL